MTIQSDAKIYYQIQTITLIVIKIFRLKFHTKMYILCQKNYLKYYLKYYLAFGH